MVNGPVNEEVLGFNVVTQFQQNKALLVTMLCLWRSGCGTLAVLAGLWQRRAASVAARPCLHQSTLPDQGAHTGKFFVSEFAILGRPCAKLSTLGLVVLVLSSAFQRA